MEHASETLPELVWIDELGDAIRSSTTAAAEELARAMRLRAAHQRPSFALDVAAYRAARRGMEC